MIAILFMAEVYYLSLSGNRLLKSAWKCNTILFYFDTSHSVTLGSGIIVGSLQWRHNERDGVLNHQPHDCLLNRLVKAQVEENIKASRHWPLCGEFTGGRWISRTKGQ